MNILCKDFKTQQSVSNQHGQVLKQALFQRGKLQETF